MIKAEWICSGDLEKKIMDAVSREVTYAVKTTMKSLDIYLGLGKGERWELSAFSNEWGELDSKGVPLRQVFKSWLEPGLHDPEHYDSLVAELKWCLAFAEKVARESKPE